MLNVKKMFPSSSCLQIFRVTLLVHQLVDIINFEVVKL
jgi:hypothetical protein